MHKERREGEDLSNVLPETPFDGLAELYVSKITDKMAEDCKRPDTSQTVQRVEHEVEHDAEKDINMLPSTLCSRHDALTSVNITYNHQEKNEKAMVFKHNVKSIVNEEAVPDAVGDGNMLTSHEVFSDKKFETKESAELNKEERKVELQRSKSRSADQQKVRAAHDQSKERFDLVMVDKTLHFSMRKNMGQVRMTIKM